MGERDDKNTLENARVGYTKAVDLWIYMGGEVWSRFNVMLVANSIVLAAVGILASAILTGNLSNVDHRTVFLLMLLNWMGAVRWTPSVGQHWGNVISEGPAVFPRYTNARRDLCLPATSFLLTVHLIAPSLR